MLMRGFVLRLILKESLCYCQAVFAFGPYSNYGAYCAPFLDLETNLFSAFKLRNEAEYPAIKASCHVKEF